MLVLHARDNVALGAWRGEDVLILRVTEDPQYPRALRASSALLVRKNAAQLSEVAGFGTVLLTERPSEGSQDLDNALLLSPALSYLRDGDVVRITPAGSIGVLYRLRANANSLLVTERCNSFCVMCSQPPRDVDDGFLVDELLRAIPLIDKSTHEIGITGGEPTLLGERFLDLIRSLKANLPSTSLHVLSNGRNFHELSLAAAVASVRHHDLMFGIPLYSDIPAIHDFVVQADGAFDQTVQGILNLKRCGVRVEIRNVLHRYTVPRVVEWARFVARNLQFVDHVALMGLESVGFAKTNIEDLWIDPVDYQDALDEAVQLLSWAGVRVSIYNHQHCVIRPESRPFAVRSISDWKNDYASECLGCAIRHSCGGFFSSGLAMRSRAIRAVEDATAGVN